MIAIGRSSIVLNVYEDALKRTAFFKVEGAPLTDAQKESRLKKLLRPLISNPHPVIDLDKREIKTEADDGPEQASITVADYYLYEQNKFILQPEAFKTFLLFLYDTPPVAITPDSPTRVMLQAYCLARRYQCADVQNGIIDLFRSYHIQQQVDFDDLIWMIPRVGDSTECLMTAYLTEQVAYDVAKNTFEVFRNTNESIVQFITNGNSHIRLALFEAIARHAADTKIADPASSGRNWHLPQNEHPSEQKIPGQADDCVIID